VKNDKKLIDKKAKIQGKALKRLEEAFDMDLEGIDPKQFEMSFKIGRLAMQYEKEMNLQKRAEENTTVRVLTHITKDPAEFAKYIKKSLPQYSPA